MLFAAGNTTAAERRVIRDRGITMVRLAKVAADPARAAREVVQGWARRFDCLLVHVDVDVLDYLDLPVAENVRRHRGLRFAQLVEALQTLVASPNWRALTVCEVNPDHGEADGSSIRTLSDGLADVLASHGDGDVERIRAASRPDVDPTEHLKIGTRSMHCVVPRLEASLPPRRHNTTEDHGQQRTLMVEQMPQLSSSLRPGLQVIRLPGAL